MEGKRAVPEERETNADGLGSSLLLLAHSFQEQPHRCALESNVLDFVLNLVFKVPQTQGGMDEAHCKGTGVLIGNTGIGRTTSSHFAPEPHTPYSPQANRAILLNGKSVCINSFARRRCGIGNPWPFRSVSVEQKGAREEESQPESANPNKPASQAVSFQFPVYKTKQNKKNPSLCFPAQSMAYNKGD